MLEKNDNLPPLPTTREVVKNLFILAIVIVLAYVVTVVIGVERLRELAVTLGPWGALLVIVVKMTTIIVVPLGGGIVYPIAGAVYGFWYGWALTLIGDFLGFATAFYLSRAFGRPIARFFVPQSQWGTFERVLAKSSSWKTLIKARIAFSPLPELFAYAAGLTKVPFIVFITIMMVLQIPGTAIFTLFGDLLLAGDFLALALAGVVGAILMFGGGWLLHKDLAKD